MSRPTFTSFELEVRATWLIVGKCTTSIDILLLIAQSDDKVCAEIHVAQWLNNKKFATNKKMFCKSRVAAREVFSCVKTTSVMNHLRTGVTNVKINLFLTEACRMLTQKNSKEIDSNFIVTWMKLLMSLKRLRSVQRTFLLTLASENSRSVIN